MTERIDYKLDDKWDMDTTAWEDFAVIRGEEVLRQNFVLLASSVIQPLAGETHTATELSRFRRRIEEQFRQNEDVDYVNIQQFELEDRTLRFTVILGSDEFSSKIIV